MNKDLASEIIRIANSLDVMGFVKEANSLDNIARKVISQVAVPEPEGNYTKDIQTYKELLYKYINNSKPAKDFLRKVHDAKYLTNQEAIAFDAQVERLRKMRKITEKERSEVNELLYNKTKKYKLDDPAIGETEFEKNWTNSNLTKDLNTVSLDTYNILKSRFRT